MVRLVVLPPWVTVALLLYCGATGSTAVASPAIASTSALVRLAELSCRPSREKPKLTMGDTVSRLEPSDSNWLTTCACAPLPTATSAITAATPITTPSMVSTERILWAVSALSATRRTISSFRILSFFVYVTQIS